MEGRVDAPWDGLAGPDAYITDLDGEIYSVHLSQADDSGYSWFEVLDARNADIALYADLIDVEESCYTDWVQSTFEPFGGDLLILDRIRIEPNYLGRGYGLYAAELMIHGFGPNMGLVACIPAPYELLQSEDARERKPGSHIPGWKPAEAKLRQYWSLLGFQQVPGSDVFALSLTTRRPSMQEIMQKYFARTR